ncbi:MAG: DEAD/DEAH box helicase [Bacillota bacterium]
MDSNWILETFGKERYLDALGRAKQYVVYEALTSVVEELPSRDRKLEDHEMALEVAELSVVAKLRQSFEKWSKDEDVRKTCKEAFVLARSLPLPEDPVQAAKFHIRMSCFAYLGDCGAHMRRTLNERAELRLPTDSLCWGERVFARVAQSWLLLVRKRDWDDLHSIFQSISSLRDEQKSFEQDYLEDSEANRKAAAWELICLYHLARAVEILATYIGQGRPNTIFQELEFHFERALVAARASSLIELEMLLVWMHAGSQKMASDSIWMVTRAYNSKITKFVEQVTSGKHGHPMLELLPPQRYSLLQQGLLDPAHRAVVVNMPTSSGKTLLAEFRILQALNYFRDEGGWVAYLVPTRALVNQVTRALRRDLEPVGVQIEKVTPAFDVHSIEESMLLHRGESNYAQDAAYGGFDVLVATPEKLDFLVRNGWEERIGRPLTLVVFDEAHNIASPKRGLRMELLLATINRECRHAQFLLLTPYIPNGDEIARWLDPQNAKAISVGLSWQSNERAIGLVYPVKGLDRNHWRMAFRTLSTSHDSIEIPDRLLFGNEKPPLKMTYNQAKRTKLKIAAAAANELRKRGDTVVVLANNVSWVWSTARTLRENSERKPISHEVSLVQRFLMTEMGQKYDLVDLLNYGIGVHHSGLSEEVRFLMEWLVEDRLIDFLVCTTTIAQGVNFPVSSIVLTDHKYPWGKEMPAEDFWNLAGRAGRLFQQTLGLVVFASETDKNNDIEGFVMKSAKELASTLESMVDQMQAMGAEVGLEHLTHDGQWSDFVQYLAHAYRQIGNHERFLAETELILRSTFGYQALAAKDRARAGLVLGAVKQYANRMKETPYLGLVDVTGFSPETIGRTIMNMRDLRLSSEDWSSNCLFSGERGRLRDLIGVMLSIPEIAENLRDISAGFSMTGSQIASLAIDWVSGRPLSEIALKYFSRGKKEKTVTEALTDCSRALFRHLTYVGPWGLYSLQNLPGSALNFEEMDEHEARNIRNLPAMLYYGVDTAEAIAMRMLGVPRSAAPSLGAAFEEEVGDVDLFTARKWLKGLSSAEWAKCLPRELHMSGGDFREVWKIISGE